MLLTVELLAPLRYGATVAEIASDIRDTADYDYCERTIHRDLKALELLGVVEPVRRRGPERGGLCIVRWRWIFA